MINKQNLSGVIFCIVLLIFGCKKKYDSPAITPSKGYLVVEGFINSDGGATTIFLSRTIPLADTARLVRERKAQVNIQSETNTSYPLTEVSPGAYVSNALTLDKTTRYRI